MTDLICRKSMMRCQTPGMCSPHGGCQPSALIETNVRYSASSGAGMTDTTELKRLAEAAAQGQDTWFAAVPEGAAINPTGAALLIGPRRRDLDRMVAYVREDAEFIAAANPSAILALIAENDDYQAGQDRYEDLCEDQRNEIRDLKAVVEALRKQVADLSPFKGAPLTGPETRCLACGGYHYGLGNLPCPKMRAIACAETYMANQRIVPVEPMIAGPHPLDAAMSKEPGHD